MIGPRSRASQGGRTIAHCPPELLDDLGDVFADLRAWAGVVEKRPGVFYLSGQPFLHFHLLAGNHRRADIKGQMTWTQLELPRPFGATKRRTLISALRRHYREKLTRRNGGRRGIRSARVVCPG
jgi:hypothetical protein